MSEIQTILPGILAFAVSAYALYVSRTEARKARDEDTVRSSYDEFEQLGRLRMDHWRASHLFETPDNYAQVKYHLAIALAPLTEAAHSQLLLSERAVAIVIFDLFEETCYQHERAEKQGDRDRVDFLKTVLDYFTGRLLANPRLRWLWSAHGGNMRAFFEPQTVELYEATLQDGDQLGIGDGENQIDPTGPYLAATKGTAE